MASVKLRARRPAPASRTIVSATCATMSSSRARICRRLLVPPRVLSERASAIRTLRVPQAVSRLRTRATPAADTAAKATAGQRTAT